MRCYIILTGLLTIYIAQPAFKGRLTGVIVIALTASNFLIGVMSEYSFASGDLYNRSS